MALVAVAGLLATNAQLLNAPATAAAATFPNVVVIMTDDQTVESLRVMARTRALIGDAGVTFSDSIVVNSLCCPSRATFLTGQHSKTHGVYTNVPPHGGMWVLDHSNTLPVWLQQAGYGTAFIGKSFNGVGVPGVAPTPPGWNVWEPLTKNGYTDFDMVQNGSVVSYRPDSGAYATDVIAERAVASVDAFVAGGSPFFLWVNTFAPHAKPEAAPRHAGLYATEPLPSDPAINEADVRDKPPYLSSLPLLGATQLDAITTRYRSELETLLAVDELVATVTDRLAAHGILDNTIVVFTSDNGMTAGQHRLPTDKRYPFEPSIRVPLLVRGPGFPAGTTYTQTVANIDLATTIAAAAGATPGRQVEGLDLRALVATPPTHPRALLIEGEGARPGQCFDAIRQRPWKYVRHLDGTEEMYNVERDPSELLNQAGNLLLQTTRSRLAGLLDKQRVSGRSCIDGPQVDLGSAMVVEPGTGTVDVNLPVTISIPQHFSTTVTLTATHRTTSGADAELLDTAVTVAPGSTTAVARLRVAADTELEDAEVVDVGISAVVTSNPNAPPPRIGRAASTLVVADCRSCGVAPRASIGGVMVAEGHHGTREARIPVTLSAPATRDAAVTVEARPTADNGTGDITWPRATARFPTGTVAAEAVIVLSSDYLWEPVEQWDVYVLTSSFRVGRAPGWIRISNDDAPARPAR